MKSVIKKVVSFLLFATVLMGTTLSAMAATSTAGIAVDALNPLLDEFLSETFDTGTFNISTEELIGKAGTIYFNFDKDKILIVGDTTYRTYEFTDEMVFKVSVASICAVIDMNDDFLDLGVKLYWVQNNETKQITADELSQVGAQMATMLQ